MNVTYNDRLQGRTFVVNKISDTSDKTIDRDYEYYGDGGLKFIKEMGSDMQFSAVQRNIACLTPFTDFALRHGFAV